MPALDKYHRAVVNALNKEGWTITDDPLRLTLGARDLFVDLGAERLIGAEQGMRRIAVEIKTFATGSPIADLQQAVGQFSMYEDVLALTEPERELYLAVPEEARRTIFNEDIGQMMLTRRLRRLISFSVAREEIVEWIP